MEDQGGSDSQRHPHTRLKVILLVGAVITILVLAGLYWYVATLGFGSNGPPAPGAAIWHQQIPNGFRWTFGYWTPEDAAPVPWSEVEIQLTDGRHNATWEDISAQDLDTGALVTKSYESVVFGDMTVFLNITDMEGDGIAEYRDNFEITASGGAFSSDEVYLLFVIWKPNSGWISTDFIVWGY